MTSSKRRLPTTAQMNALQMKFNQLDILKDLVKRYQSLAKSAMDNGLRAQEIIEMILAENDVMMKTAEGLLAEIQQFISLYKPTKFVN